MSARPCRQCGVPLISQLAACRSCGFDPVYAHSLPTQQCRPPTMVTKVAVDTAPDRVTEIAMRMRYYWETCAFAFVAHMAISCFPKNIASIAIDAVLSLGIVYSFCRLGWALGKTRNGKIFNVVCAATPGVNFLALLAFSHNGNAELKAAGIKNGFLGPKSAPGYRPEQAKWMRRRGWALGVAFALELACLTLALRAILMAQPSAEEPRAVYTPHTELGVTFEVAEGWKTSADSDNIVVAAPLHIAALVVTPLANDAVDKVLADLLGGNAANFHVVSTTLPVPISGAGGTWSKITGVARVGEKPMNFALLQPPKGAEKTFLALIMTRSALNSPEAGVALKTALSARFADAPAKVAATP